MRTFLGRSLAILCGLIAAVLALELGLRVWSPVELDGSAWSASGGEARAGATVGQYRPDDDLGFRPVLGGSLHASHGALHNDYALEKRAGVPRLLFLGDSVTRRGELVAALRAELGESCEFWNAGVEGYATWQEVAFYREDLAGIGADHVILTFHLNDYLTTPITFRAGDEVVAVRERNRVERPLAWLWKISYLYRLTSARAAVEDPQLERADPGVARREVERALVELRDLVQARGARLTVLVLPWLRPRAEWPPSLPGKHEHVVEVLTRAGIPHFTFLEELETALAAGEDIQEKPRDPQHPSAAFARRMARGLLARGFVP